MAPFYIFLWGRLARFFKYLSTFADRPVPFELVWILAALVQLNHSVHLCSRVSSGASLICRRRVTSSVLGIAFY